MRHRILPGLCLGLLSAPAAAHPGHGQDEGLGLLHYLSTPEHAAGLGLLALLIVGVVAYSRGRQRR